MDGLFDVFVILKPQTIKRPTIDGPIHVSFSDVTDCRHPIPVM